MKWHGHNWKAFDQHSNEPGDSAPSLPRTYWDGYIISAHMPKSKPEKKMQGSFVEQNTRDRIVKLWNATRHLEDDELDKVLGPIKNTQSLADIPGITIGNVNVGVTKYKQEIN